MVVLVTGGAGYIGSHAVAALLEKGEQVVIIDNLYQGHKDAVLGGKLYEGDLRDADFVAKVFQENDIDGVIHFAANSLVGESMKDPGKYYHNNVYGTLCLLEQMQKAGVPRIVFSSTAATYGEPERVPIDEYDRTLPTNAYGETKLAMEKMIRWFDVAHGIKFVSLRYFNAAGAHESGRIGEDHSPESHLVPLVLQVALGQREYISVFGEDYPTDDGTCIRDYVHVSDLADAHILALERLRKGEDSAIYNLGSGNGYSVKQVIDVSRQVTGHPIPAKIEPRRAGDPAVLIASSDRARKELGWAPRREKLEDIVTSSWNWHRQHPNGYEK
ncbi:UDP-glucose 4-epimerase GalE [Cohnella silvisoli]|uniref:UDP-glucose 4-epimerase n=1 Tax=Cohnella silvisoli TaxID=2873699 RepID=A0ABV1L4F0_9BACL|nr:UDP-glucose 4-epimerase GalE [Cohnella silvisoli]MCD9025991.1 UDP-glucose 4-epimerase GalE [Cohnella silvisoli]